LFLIPGDVFFKGDDGRESQPYFLPSGNLGQGEYLAYVDVWERHLSFAETDGAIELERRSPPWLREVALNGADTASRAQVVWQVRVVKTDGNPPADPTNSAQWREWLQNKLHSGPPGILKAEAQQLNGMNDNDPCVVSSETRYRGVENQLYRVEIHQGGAPRKDGDGATWKWSRENGSVVFAVDTIEDRIVRLSHWWRDDRLGLKRNDLVEVLDDATAILNERGAGEASAPLSRVVNVDQDAMTVKLDSAPALPSADPERHPIIRRWDHPSGSQTVDNGQSRDHALPVVEDEWIDLENGIRVLVEKDAENPSQPNYYRSGDYWLIPARTALGDILWPRRRSTEPHSFESEGRSPDGIDHHYAPLGIVEVDGNGGVTLKHSLRLGWSALAG
jgi:hypothetical protein